MSAPGRASPATGGVAADGPVSAARRAGEVRRREPAPRPAAARWPADGAAEKALLTAGVLALWLAVYFGAARLADPARAASLRTGLDDRIPFVPRAIWLYATVYTAMLLPIFTVRPVGAFRRVVAAYAATILVSGAVFVAFPVTAVGFRPDVSRFGDGALHLWGLRLAFFLDPPVNLFPSLHLSIATLAALASWSVRRAYGALAGLLALAIAAAVLLVKQHFWLDAVAGVALGAVAWASFVRPRVRRGAGAAYGCARPVSHVPSHARALVAAAALWSAGVRPWAQ